MRSLVIMAAAMCVMGCGAKVIADPDAAPPPNCVYPDTPTSLERGCSANVDCMIVERQVSCCKVEEDGIRGDAGAAFLSSQQASTKACFSCGCLAQPTDESGNTGTSFVATCDNHLCIGHAK
jgi:hypothetical protein